MADTPAGALDSVDTTRATVAVKPAAAKGKFLSPTLAGTQHLDTEAGKSILENMQRLIDEKEAQKSSFLERLKDAAAWTTGGVQGPTEGLALRGKAREEQTTDIYNMRMQLAQQRAAAEAAKQDAAYWNTPQGAPGAPGVAGAPGAAGAPGMSRAQAQIAGLPQPLQDQVTRLYATGQSEAANKIIREEYLKQPDPMKMLAYADKIESTQPAIAEAIRREYLKEAMKPRLDVNAQGEQFNVRGMTAEQLSRNRPAPAPVAAPAPVVAPAPVALREPDVDRPTVTLAGPSDNRTPAPPPAPGAETIPYKSLPKAGQMVVDYLENQNKEGMLGKVQMPDVPSAAAAPAVTPAPVAPAATPVKPKVKTLGEIAAETKGAEEAATATAKDTAQAYAGFMQSTNAYANADRARSADRVVQLTTETPEAVGVLTDPGVVNAIATIVSQGASTPWGSISLGGLEDAISKVMVDSKGNLLSPQVQKNRNEIAQLLAKNELEFAKINMKNQGAISDMERALLGRASGSIKDNPELLIKRQMMMSEMAKSEAADGALFRELYPNGGVAAYKEFRDRKEHRDLVDKFNDKADAIIKMDIKLPKSSGAAAAPAAPPARPVFKDAAEAEAYKKWKESQRK